ncbi:MAG: hypothetical protein WCJ37_03415 [Syntrophus sp. (in: bacteria)]
MGCDISCNTYSDILAIGDVSHALSRLKPSMKGITTNDTLARPEDRANPIRTLRE